MKNMNFALPLIGKYPAAFALIKGSAHYPDILGRVSFYPMREGSFVLAQVTGLPQENERVIMPLDVEHSACMRNPVFAFHLHSGSSCTGTEQNPFANAGSHFNPHDCPHPYHAGDLPPLFGNDGYALSAFYTGRFRPREAIGHTVIIHANPDDFTTQPSGAAGEMIACGEVVKY